VIAWNILLLQGWLIYDVFDEWRYRDLGWEEGRVEVLGFWFSDIYRCQCLVWKFENKELNWQKKKTEPAEIKSFF
jgi:hypothetical protein